MAADPLEHMPEVIDQALKLTSAGEAILGVMAHIGPSIQTLTRLVDNDPELIPELQGAVEALGECSDALGRAVVFVNARFEVAHERMVKGVDDATS